MDNPSPNVRTALDIFQKFNFEIEGGGGQHWSLEKTYHDHNKILISINGLACALYVRISGYSIKQERTIEYDFEADANDIKRLEDRLKRLLKRASTYDETCKKEQVQKDNIYERIRDSLMMLGALSKAEKRTIHQHWGGKTAYLTINGYEISVNEDIFTSITINNESKYVNIEAAIQIINMMPTHVPYKED